MLNLRGVTRKARSTKLSCDVENTFSSLNCSQNQPEDDVSVRVSWASKILCFQEGKWLRCKVLSPRLALPQSHRSVWRKPLHPNDCSKGSGPQHLWQWHSHGLGSMREPQMCGNSKKKIEMVELWEETHIGLWHQDSNGKSAIFSRKHIVESAMIQVSICL